MKSYFVYKCKVRSSINLDDVYQDFYCMGYSVANAKKHLFAKLPTGYFELVFMQPLNVTDIICGIDTHVSLIRSDSYE